MTGPSPGLGDERPAGRDGMSVGIAAGGFDEHSAAIRPEARELIGCGAEERREGSQRGEHPDPHREGGGAQAEMQDRQLEPGAKDRRPADIEPLWNEIEVRRLAEREEARPEPGQVLANEQAPSGPLLPGAIEEHTHRAAGIGQDRAHDRQAARRAVARRNGDLDCVDAAPAGGQPVEHGVRERRGRACAGDRRHAGGAGRCIKARKSGDEIAGVCEIHIVHAGRDRRLGEAIVALLERAGGVDDREGAESAQRIGVDRVSVDRGSLDPRSGKIRPQAPPPSPPPGRRCGRQ